MLFRSLRSNGSSLWSDPSLRVTQERSYEIGDYWSERFHYGRAYAALRSEDFSPLRRGLFAFSSPLLVPLFIFRTAARVLRRPRYLPRFLAALPFVVAYACAASAGECAGYLAGAGRSAEQIA